MSIIYSSIISRRTGLARATVTRYLNEDFNPVHASFGKKRVRKLTPYIKEIDQLLEKGIMGSKIEEHIRQQGYDASSSTVRNYIAEWKKKNKMSDNLYKVATRSNTNIIKIKRSTILNMLFKPLDTIKGIDNNTLELLFKQYPFIQQTINLVTKFKEIVISNNANALIKWIADVRETNISEIISFANGLERDYNRSNKCHSSSV